MENLAALVVLETLAAFTWNGLWEVFLDFRDFYHFKDFKDFKEQQ